MHLKTMFITMILALSSTAADATTFSYDFQRFTGTGNQYGSLTDEFTDPALSGWTVVRGTAVQSGSVVTLQDPGQPLTYNFPGFTLLSETSSLRNDALVYDGLGDFTIETVISQQIAPPDQFAGLTFSFGANNSLALSYSNWGADIAAATGVAQGLSVSFDQLQIDSYGLDFINSSSFMSDRSYFTAGDVTGDIWLRIAFQDATNEFTASYSIDGGSTFTTVSTYQTSATGWGGRAGLVADPKSVPEPSLALLLGSGLLGAAARRRRLRAS